MTDNTEKPQTPVRDLEAPQVGSADAVAIRGGFLGGLMKPVGTAAGTAVQSPKS